MKLQHTILALLVLVLCPSAALAQTYHLLHVSFGSGGTTSSSSSYLSTNTVGQPDVGSDSSADFRQSSGFWNEYEALGNYFATSYGVVDGWNLVSVPQTVENYEKSVLFPDAASSAFVYLGTYQTKDTLRNGAGYWLKFSGSQNIALVGIPRTTDTIPVVPRWNIIGSIADSVDTSTVIVDPPGIITSKYFGYDDGYVPAKTIEPGKAYWVETNSDGRLVLNAPTAQTATTRIYKSDDELNTLNTLTAERLNAPTTSHPKTLLFGSIGNHSLNLASYKLPPKPPTGAVDMRFASNRFVELFDNTSNKSREVPLSIESNGAPLKLTWTIKELGGIKYSLVEKKGGKVLATHRWKENGSITIDGDIDKSYGLRVEQIPQVYQLYQNYPNPFNPSTSIRFDLPERAMVTLKIYNVLGEEVAAPLKNQEMDEGQQSLSFNALNISTGAYFYRMNATSLTSGKNFQSVKKMLLMK